jgi:hypothetical protein
MGAGRSEWPSPKYSSPADLEVRENMTSLRELEKFCVRWVKEVHLLKG